MNTLAERFDQAEFKASKLIQAFAAADPQNGTTFELYARRGEALTAHALVTYLGPGWRWERLAPDGHVLETWERGNMSDFLPWVVFQFEYTHVRIGETFHKIPALLPQDDGPCDEGIEQDGADLFVEAPMVVAPKAGERPSTTEAEALVTSLLYKLLTFYANQAVYDGVSLTLQEHSLIERGQITKFERYPLPSLPWGKPLEEAITWSLADGRKFKILVQDITEEYQKQP